MENWRQYMLMEDEELSAQSDLTPEVEVQLVAGEIPQEFAVNPGSEIVNEIEASGWAKEIIEKARAQLIDHLKQGGSSDRKKSPNIYRFKMKTPEPYPLTAQMREAGWTQWQSTIMTKSKEDAEAEGVRYKKFRYPVHYWVSPTNQLALGKLKLQGKFIPDLEEVA